MYTTTVVVQQAGAAGQQRAAGPALDFLFLVLRMLLAVLCGRPAAARA